MAGLMKIIKSFNLGVSFDTPFFYKNCSLRFLEKNFGNDLTNKIKDLFSLLPERKFFTVDIGYQVFKEGTKTCKNTGWHVDGVGNDYLIFCQGDFRTEFLADVSSEQFPDVRGDLLRFNNSIACKYSDHAGKEIPDATIVQYNSTHIHRGRRATHEGQRIFLRLCSSEYLVPSNVKML